MASDTLIFAVRAAASRLILDKLPRKCPSWRDTNLQIAMLERMAEKFRKRFWVDQVAPVLGGKVSKGRKKAMGNELAKLNQQSKKVRSSLGRTLEEGFYHDYPESKVTPRAVRRALADTNRQFEQVILQATRDRQKALEAVAEPKQLPK